ncbi:MAG TPA: hypothetical protein VGC75_06660 [Candidatus Nitrosocosmicus sp.]|jgi:hypothetical protein
MYFSITGNSNDYEIEVASGSWVGRLLIPSVYGLFINGRSIGLAVDSMVGAIMAYEFEKKLWQKNNRSN